MKKFRNGGIVPNSESDTLKRTVKINEELALEYVETYLIVNSHYTKEDLYRAFMAGIESMGRE